MVRAGGQVHIPVSRLGKPAGTQHLPLANGAFILRSGHGGQGLLPALVAIVDLPGDTAGQFCPVEAVLMAFQGPSVLPDAPFQVQPGANEGRMVRIPQSIMGRAGAFDAEHLHGGL